MIQFKARIEQFGSMGEKTGWTYIRVPQELAQQLVPGNKKSFRVKGKLDDYSYHQLALIPMGDGDFILALNAAIRKQIKKAKGTMLQVSMAVDQSAIELSADLLDCLKEDDQAATYFEKLPRSHKLYYSKWIESAKSIETKSKRIIMAMKALSRQMNYGEMMRYEKENRL